MGHPGDGTFRIGDLVSWTPRQWKAWYATRKGRYVLYGGARGGGKSRFLRWWCVIWLIYMWRKTGLTRIRVMLACESYPDLRDRQLTKIKTEFPSWLGDLRDNKEDGLCFFLKEEFGGGIIALRNLDDPAKYQSAEFAAIVVDELTKVLKDVFDILRGSLRWPGILHTVFLAATNPGGIGHGWVKSLWIDREFPPELVDRAHEFIFIQSLPSDNPYLERSYWDELNSLPNELRRAWVDGDWTVFAGQFFEEFRLDKHVVKPFQIPPDWRTYTGIDYGTTNPFCCLWGAVDYNDDVWIFRELYRPGLNATQQARLIKANNEGITPYAYVADPSMWIKNQGQGEIMRAIADYYMDEGIMLTRGNNDRIHGWNVVREYMKWDERQKPRLHIFDTCKNLIRTLPSLVHDDNRVEDVDTDGEDHAADALRYQLLYAYKPSRPKDESWTDQGFRDHNILEFHEKRNKVYDGERFV